MPRDDMDFTKDRQECELEDIKLGRLLASAMGITDEGLLGGEGVHFYSFTPKADRDAEIDRLNATRESISVFIVKITPEQQAAVRALFQSKEPEWPDEIDMTT